MTERNTSVALVVVLVAGLLVVPVEAAAAVDTEPIASHEGGTAPVFAAEVAGDGTVGVTVRYTFDLSDETGANAFAERQTNETARAAFPATFQNRMELVASDTATTTDRDVTVGNASIECRTAGSTGVVELSVPVRNLAAIDGDRVVLGEPFASNSQSEREFRVVLPDGHELVSTTPEPTGTGDGDVVYAAGTSLDGFELVGEEPGADGSGDGAGGGEGNDSSGNGGDGATPGGSSPGFGVLTALGALAAVLAGLRVR